MAALLTHDNWGDTARSLESADELAPAVLT